MASMYRNCQRADGKTIAVLDGKNIIWDCPGTKCPCPKTDTAHSSTKQSQDVG